MKLVVGLGNPGRQYHKTWHNVGFVAANYLAEKFAFGGFKPAKKFRAEIAEGLIDEVKTIIAKPQTMMNDSGAAVGALAKYYRIEPADIIVIHDDLDLPLERIKIVTASAAGGHNGVQSIIRQLKTNDFVRVKIGVATTRKEQLAAADYVLAKIGLFQSGKVKAAVKKAAEAAAEAVMVSPASAMNKFNQK